MNIDFIRIKNDINGNPRYVCHFLNFINSKEELPIHDKYDIALKRAKNFGGRKFHNKQYGGGIVFQSYNIHALSKEITQYVDDLI